MTELPHLSVWLRKLGVVLVSLVASQIATLPAQAEGPGTPIEVTGYLEILHSDDFEGGRSETDFFLRDESSGDTYKLNLQVSPGDLYSGQEVTVWGWSTDSRIEVDELVTAQDADGGLSNQSLEGASPQVRGGHLDD